MPFTPFHMGPGILIKALLQSSFSLMVFGWSQIVMDIQPLIVLVTGEGHLHGFSHTYIGASLLAVFSGVTGKYLSQLVLWLLQLRPSYNIHIPWWVVFVSAFIGAFSHVFIDSLMHSDLEPFYPFTARNPFLRWVSVETLHRICLYSGLTGAVIYYYVRYKFVQHKSRAPVE